MNRVVPFMAMISALLVAGQAREVNDMNPFFNKNVTKSVNNPPSIKRRKNKKCSSSPHHHQWETKEGKGTKPYPFVQHGQRDREKDSDGYGKVRQNDDKKESYHKDEEKKLKKIIQKFKNTHLEPNSNKYLKKKKKIQVVKKINKQKHTKSEKQYIHYDQNNDNHHSENYIQKCLARQNTVRAEVGAPPLRWNPKLAVESKRWSSSLSSEHALQHSDAITGRYAENIYFGGGWSRNTTDLGEFCEKGADAWIAEKVYYTGQFDHETGHYHILIDKNYKTVGCGIYNKYLTCRYQ